ncbi:DUF2141 domain-containing protein [Roseimarinus sediminis]|uniref:DUF2141 domain-containing protein n=1 Tax=Roseimarinus sediminis TaxID=1610899 RepID=UPI003D22B6E3
MKFSIAILFTLLVSMAFSQEKSYTVSGRVNAHHPEGRVYVLLCNETSFNNEQQGIDTLSYWVNYDKTYVEYEFKNVPPGEYAIRSFQDVNHNHRFDKWLLGPLEPWGYSFSSKMKYPPAFSDISFGVYYDTRINIALGK